MPKVARKKYADPAELFNPQPPKDPDRRALLVVARNSEWMAKRFADTDDLVIGQRGLDQATAVHALRDALDERDALQNKLDRLRELVKSRSYLVHRDQIMEVLGE